MLFSIEKSHCSLPSLDLLAGGRDNALIYIFIILFDDHFLERGWKYNRSWKSISFFEISRYKLQYYSIVGITKGLGMRIFIRTSLLFKPSEVIKMSLIA